MILVKGKSNSEVEDGYATAGQYRTEGAVGVTQVVRDTYKDSAAAHANAYSASFADPVLINGVLNEKGYTQDQYSNTYFINEVLANKFFEVWIVLQPVFVPAALSYVWWFW